MSSMPLPGSFPPPPSTPYTLSPATSFAALSPSSTTSRDLSLSPTPSRPPSRGGVQSRRPTTSSLGLGVSFALPPSFSPSSSRSRAASRASSHSRHSSISSAGWSAGGSDADMPFPLSPEGSVASSSSFLSPQLGGEEYPTPTASRHPSRRPSLTHLASFLSGIEHHTRVRSPGMGGGRGVSRSASRSGSRVGLDRTLRRGDGASRRSSMVTGGERDWRTYEEEEEPFLDTAPSSPTPGRAKSVRSDGGGGGLEDVEVFEEGERVGVGVWLEGRGGWATDCFGGEMGGEGGVGNGLGGPGELEVVRRLGEGTYAIVYLVKEVLFDPDPEDVLSPIDPSASFDWGMSSTPTPTSWAAEPLPRQAPTYGRSFALKCLCKKDLTDELIEIQRGEAILHRALPDHEYIVRLYGAYETDDWLFLVLEYCPGQDLFFWLQADDSDLYDLSRATSPYATPSSPIQYPTHPAAQPITGGPTSTSPDPDEGALSRTVTSNTTEFDHTPPSPSLLSSTATNSLLSRKRLRLISRMFGQMCSAVQACHDVGISHRDIKPENFIVMDGRENHESGGRVVVKITDWGLGTRDLACEDFDCGSKPYMAYECRNNLNPTYDPRQADVWSLGLVLLNLLYHRNPWADPSLDDPDFAEYVRDPLAFLEDRFEGIGEEVATFLFSRVFCDVLEMEGDEMRKRVTAGEFGWWASRLPMMMGESQGHRRGSVSDSTFHLESTISRPPSQSMHVLPSSSSAPSLLSQQAPSMLSQHLLSQHLLSQQFAPVSHLEELGDLPADLREELPVVNEEEEQRQPPPPFANPSPTATRVPASRTSSSFFTFDDDEPLPSPSFSPFSSPFVSSSSPFAPSLPSAELEPEPEPAAPAPEEPHGTPSPPNDGDDDGERKEEREGVGDVRCWGEPESQNPKSKRRKRGARKGRSAARTPGDTSPPIPSPLSPGSPTTLPTVDEDRERKLLELAQASENLARELSRPRPPARPTTHSVGTQSTSAIPSAGSTLRASASMLDVSGTAKNAAKSSGGGGVFGRMRGLVADGNADLNALKLRAQERNASYGPKADTYSAPAKMQGARAGGVSGASGTSSWGSVVSEDGPRGRTGEDIPGHWSSASSRRERQQKRRRAGDFSPSSSTRLSATASSLDSRNHTPLSSFSSINSVADSGAVVERDWRQPSPNPKPHSTSGTRPPPSTTTAASKPLLKDAAVDTTDLVVDGTPTPTPKVSRPTSSASVATLAAPTTHAPLLPLVSTPPPPPPPVVVVKKNKLGSLLNSISVFNRSQEKSGG